MRRKRPLQLREPELPECETPSDLIFPEAGLRFVYAERYGVAGRRSVEGGRQALFVERVAAFVHRAEERLRHFRIRVPSGDTDVLRRKAAAERVRRGVEASGLP